jgi:hypothetical protein
VRRPSGCLKRYHCESKVIIGPRECNHQGIIRQSRCHVLEIDELHSRCADDNAFYDRNAPSCCCSQQESVSLRSFAGLSGYLLRRLFGESPPGRLLQPGGEPPA